MHFDWSTFALQTVNFAVLVWLRQRFLYRPVLRLADARRAEIDKGYEAARRAEEAATAKLASIETERSGIAAERAAVLKDAVAEAEAAGATRRAQAERDAAALFDEARKSIAQEREQALAEARRTALDLGADIARRLLAEMPNKDGDDIWLTAIGQQLVKLPLAERDTLIRQVANGDPLVVATASALTPKAAAAWRLQLRKALGDGVNISFSVEPSLIAGAELHFPSAVLRFSWQSMLSQLRRESDVNGQPR